MRILRVCLSPERKHIPEFFFLLNLAHMHVRSYGLTTMLASSLSPKTTPTRMTVVVPGYADAARAVVFA